MSTTNDAGTVTEVFGATELKVNAAIYGTHAAILNAASKYDNLDDAVAGLEKAWDILESQIEQGAQFTPAAELGFGSDNAAVIAETLLGRRGTVSNTRKQFKALGK